MIGAELKTNGDGVVHCRIDCSKDETFDSTRSGIRLFIAELEGQLARQKKCPFHVPESRRIEIKLFGGIALLILVAWWLIAYAPLS